VDASGLEIGDHAVVCEDYDADTGSLRPGPASGPQVSPGSEGRGNQKKTLTKARHFMTQKSIGHQLGTETEIESVWEFIV